MPTRPVRLVASSLSRHSPRPSKSTPARALAPLSKLRLPLSAAFSVAGDVEASICPLALSKSRRSPSALTPPPALSPPTEVTHAPLATKAPRTLSPPLLDAPHNASLAPAITYRHDDATLLLRLCTQDRPKSPLCPQMSLPHLHARDGRTPGYAPQSPRNPRPGIPGYSAMPELQQGANAERRLGLCLFPLRLAPWPALLLSIQSQTSLNVVSSLSTDAGSTINNKEG